MAPRRRDSFARSNECGQVEVDEAYVGAKLKNMHYSRKIKIQQELSKVPAWKQPTRYAGKTVVMGMFDRGSRQIRTKVVPNTKRETLQAEILNGNSARLPHLYRSSGFIRLLEGSVIHETVNRADTYVRCQVHTTA